jgi:hypothetical protein
LHATQTRRSRAAGVLLLGALALALPSTAIAGGRSSGAPPAVAADAAHQPDARYPTPIGFVGDNVYGTNGLGQQMYVQAHRGSSATIRLSLQNDGTVAQKLKLHATGAATSGYTVKYLKGTTNITAAVKAGTWKTQSLLPGKAVVVTIKVSVAHGAVSKLNRTFTVVSAVSSTSVDVAKLEITPVA